MSKRNNDIRKAIKAAGLYNYEVAEELGLNDSYFSRILHTKLSTARHDVIMAAVEALEERKGKEIDED